MLLGIPGKKFKYILLSERILTGQDKTLMRKVCCISCYNIENMQIFSSKKQQVYEDITVEHWSENRHVLDMSEATECHVMFKQFKQFRVYKPQFGCHL